MTRDRGLCVVLRAVIREGVAKEEGVIDGGVDCILEHLLAPVMEDWKVLLCKMALADITIQETDGAINE